MSGSTFRKCLKAQARLIAGVHCSAPCVVEKFLEGLFGSTGHASRVKATFAPIKGGRADLAAAGIQLDRLLQKPMPGALYWKQPVYSDVLNEATRATFEIRLSGELSEAQVGLLMLALKDAWTQRIAFGKRAAGGRLQGLEATISYGGKQALLISEPQVSRYRSPALRVQGDADLLSILEEAINKLKAELKQQEIDALREERAPAGAP
jgi:hypothetical protein